MACPCPDVRCPALGRRGAKLGGKPKELLVPSGCHRRGEDRTGELREPSLMPRQPGSGRWKLVRGAGTVSLKCGRRRLGTISSPGRAPLSPGYRGHPSRSCLVCAERGNPVEVQPAGGWEADREEGRLLGGNRMTKKRMSVVERRQETIAVDRSSN